MTFRPQNLPSMTPPGLAALGALLVLVSRLTGKDNLALEVGDGWVGDRLYRWEGPEEVGATEWVTRWATPEDVEDFIWGLGKMLKARYPGSALRAEDGAQLLATQDRLFRVERSALEVRILVLPPKHSL